MAVNPNAQIIFLDGQLQPALNLATNVCIKLGPATGGPLLRPLFVSQTSSVLQFLHGPLVASGAYHVDYGSGCYLMRTNASIDGTIGSVSKILSTTAIASAGTMTVALTSYTIHATIDALVAASTLNVTTGWVEPSAPLPVTIVSGAGTVAHTQTFTYVDSAGDTQTGTISISAAGTHVTSFSVARVISVTSNVAPVGTQAYTTVFTTPGDRYDFRAKVIAGGVLGVSGGTTPKVQVSLDDGRTYSRTLQLASDGVLELTTYAGGLTPQPTGLTLTFTAGTIATNMYGSLRVAGATTPGDVVYTKKTNSAVTVTHVVPTTNNASISVGVSTYDITVTSATSGGTAATYAGFGGQLAGVAFTAATVGSGGNSITVATVADGTGAGSVSVVGNAITIHYEDGVTTVTQVKSHFPVVTTFSSVTATGGTGANVLAAPGDTHGATNLATGTNASATTTANDVVDAIEADASANALVSVVAVGAGTGLMAAAASSGFANSQVAYTPKREGVQVRHASAGISNASIVVAVVGNLVTVYPVTDSNGIQTSTAAQIETAVNASATASLLLVADASGSGAGLASMTADYLALPVSAATGDQFTFVTTPPQWSAVDLAEALAELLTNDAALDGFSMLHFLGNADDDDLTSIQTWLDSLETEQRKYKSGYIEATYMGSTVESTWLAGVLAGYTQIDTNPRVGIGAGEANIVNSAYGTIDRRNVTTPYMARTMICSISELPSHVDCQTDLGIQNSLNGVLVRTSPTSGTVPPLWQTDDTLVQLNAQNFVTLRTFAGRTGIYVRQGLMYCVDGSDYLYVTNRRTADVVAPVAYDEILRNLNANMLVDPATGQLAEVEIQRMESNVTSRVQQQVMGGQRSHISGVRTVIDRGTNFQATGTITGRVAIVGRTPATTITLSLGYVRVLN